MARSRTRTERAILVTDNKVGEESLLFLVVGDKEANLAGFLGVPSSLKD